MICSMLASLEPELGGLVPVDYKNMSSGDCTLAKALAQAHRVPAPIHRTLTLANLSLGRDRSCVCNGWKLGVRKVVNMYLGNVTHWRTERTERGKR